MYETSNFSDPVCSFNSQLFLKWEFANLTPSPFGYSWTEYMDDSNPGSSFFDYFNMGQLGEE
jgi:hypothetical protein